MRKLLQLFLNAFILTTLSAQEQREQTLTYGKTNAPVYSNDLIIKNDPQINQRRVRLSVAFNGWLYAAYNTVDSASNAGGITIRSSRNNGVTWQTIDTYTAVNVRYPAHDIVVAGTDTNNLTLYLVGVNNNTASGNYIVYVDRYNATTGNFIGSNFNQPNGTRKIYDVAIASDYRFPAVGASPYSVAFIYSTFSSSRDSICSVVSVNGGTSFTVRNTIATTPSYYRNISLAYGKSLSASNGRYFATWESLSSSTKRTGNIYFSRNASTVNGAWTPQKNLDSLNNTMTGACRNPKIACQFNTIDNDSSSLTALVLVERDYNGTGSDYDVLGFYNKKAHFANFWNRLDVSNTSQNEIHPHVNYDPAYNNFIATYFDSTNKKLPYVVNSFNLTAPNNWIVIKNQYNDLTTNLKNPYPRVEINPVTVQAAHAWIAEGVGTKGVAMFDAEYNNSVGIGEVKREGTDFSATPNPAVNHFNINYNLSYPADVTIKIYNTTGQLMDERKYENMSIGKQSHNYNTDGWKSGVYIYNIYDGLNTYSGKIIISR